MTPTISLHRDLNGGAYSVRSSNGRSCRFPSGWDWPALARIFGWPDDRRLPCSMAKPDDFEQFNRVVEFLDSKDGFSVEDPGTLLF